MKLKYGIAKTNAKKIKNIRCLKQYRKEIYDILLRQLEKPRLDTHPLFLLKD